MMPAAGLLLMFAELATEHYFRFALFWHLDRVTGLCVTVSGHAPLSTGENVFGKKSSTVLVYNTFAWTLLYFALLCLLV